MTRSLERAITELQKLPAEEQDAIAARILEEIADKRRWEESFARSQDQVAKMAQKAREEMRH